jgi:hypothetical protein
MAAIGRSIQKLDVDNRVAAVVEQLWSALNAAKDLNGWMTDAQLGGTDANLTALGYQAADLSTLRSGVADLGSASGLWGVAHAQSHPAANNDFFFRAKLWTGINFTG